MSALALQIFCVLEHALPEVWVSVHPDARWVEATVADTLCSELRRALSLHHLTWLGDHSYHLNIGGCGHCQNVVRLLRVVSWMLLGRLNFTTSFRYVSTCFAQHSEGSWIDLRHPERIFFPTMRSGVSHSGAPSADVILTRVDSGILELHIHVFKQWRA
eukprot:1418221-Amphidinium_carterae.1